LLTELAREAQPGLRHTNKIPQSNKFVLSCKNCWMRTIPPQQTQGGSRRPRTPAAWAKTAPITVPYLVGG